MFRIPVAGNLLVDVVLSLFPAILFVLLEELFVVWLILFPNVLLSVVLFSSILFPVVLLVTLFSIVLFSLVTSFLSPLGFDGVSSLTLKLTVWSL